MTRDFYVEEGSTVSASGYVAVVWCVIDGETHEQVGESFSSSDLAEAVVADWNGPTR